MKALELISKEALKAAPEQQGTDFPKWMKAARPFTITYSPDLEVCTAPAHVVGEWMLWGVMGARRWGCRCGTIRPT